jgi:hypothetical protein
MRQISNLLMRVAGPSFNDRSSYVLKRAYLYMTRFDDRTAANMDVVLDDICRVLPNNGGDHESRKFIALRLVRAARGGKRTLGALESVARQAMRKLMRSKTV